MLKNYLLMDRMPNIGSAVIHAQKSKLLLVKVAKKRMNYTEKIMAGEATGGCGHH